MQDLSAFNTRSDAYKAQEKPGEGDDVPCEKCGAAALDTGLECSECGHDNYEVVTGKPFCSKNAMKQRASPEDHIQMITSIYTARIGGDRTPYVDGPGDGFGYDARFLRPDMRFSTEADAQAAAKCSNEAYHQGFMASQQAIRKALDQEA